MSVDAIATGALPLAPAGGERWLTLARRARWLSWLSLAVMTAEGAIAITAGVLAGSVALVGFGIDSGVEGLASVVIVWRLSGSRLLSNAAETRAQKLVAAQFFVLAPYVAFESVSALATGERPAVSYLGMALAASSIVVMPLLGVAKRRIGREIGSTATRGEGAQNLLCAYLAAALLVGLAANALVGAWWLDPVVGLLIAGVAVKEGRDTLRGKGCCAVPELAPSDCWKEGRCDTAPRTAPGVGAA